MGAACEMEIDIIVFESGDRRYAIELEYVQEVFALGYITRVPLAPAPIQGATNVRGRMVPVIALEPLFGTPLTSKLLPGTTALLVAVEDAMAAVVVRRVIDVTSVPRNRYEAGGEGSGPLIPGSFRGVAGSIPLLDIATALRSVRTASQRANEEIHSRSEAR